MVLDCARRDTNDITTCKFCKVGVLGSCFHGFGSSPLHRELKTNQTCYTQRSAIKHDGSKATADLLIKALSLDFKGFQSLTQRTHGLQPDARRSDPVWSRLGRRPADPAPEPVTMGPRSLTGEGDMDLRPLPPYTP